jgi:kynureninase
VGKRLATTLNQEWGRDLITSWNKADWIGLPARVAAKIAPLIGAHAYEVMAADSTSVNIFKLAAGALGLRPDRRVILTEPGNFPTDLYVLEGLKTLRPDLEIRTEATEDLNAALGPEVALLLLTHAHYKTGRLHDMAALSAAASAAGALSLWDLSHSAGALDIDLNRDGADLAVGCGYKYLNGGPGAPAFLFVAERHQGGFRSPLTGWMGHARPFDFVDAYEPAPGMAQTLSGTPQILGLSALDAALEAFDGVSMSALRAKSMALGDLFLDLVEARCPQLELACPRAADQRGSQASLSHDEGYAIVQALIARGVIGDFRAPDVLRFGFTPLYLRFVDVWDAVDILAEVMTSEAWRRPEFQTRSKVT